MKLLFAIKGLHEAKGGAERVICQIASAMAERGHDVSLLSFDVEGQKPFYQLSDKVKQIKLGIGKPRNKTTVFEFAKRIASLRNVVKNEKPDVVIPFMYSMYVPMAFALLGTGTKIFGSEHSSGVSYKNKPFKFMLLKTAIKLMGNCSVVSQKTLETFPERVRRNMTVVPNPAGFQTEQKSSLENNVILTVGRLEEVKDQQTLIRAFALLVKKFPDWRLHIVGTGVLEDGLKSLVSELQLDNAVVFKGAVSNVEQEYCHSDIVVVPSRYESFGLSVVEAMSCGVPVIGFSECYGVNDLIISGENGLLVEGGNNRVEALSKGLGQLMADKKIRDKFAKNAAIFSKKYSLQHVAPAWEKFLCGF